MSRSPGQHNVSLVTAPKKKNVYEVSLDMDDPWEFMLDMGDKLTPTAKKAGKRIETNYARGIVSIVCDYEGWTVRVLVPSRKKKFFDFVRDFCLDRNLSFIDHVNYYNSFDPDRGV